jgi:NADH-quinone oxidoreductase subunit I
MKITRPKLTIWEELYLPQIISGLFITFKHIFKKKFTVQYPEEKSPIPPGYRGLHRLTKDENGRIRCVACEMCSVACPAHCITIVGGPSPWPDREKTPLKYDIDLLRCIFCGMCEEACPEDAIELTYIHDFSAYSREDFLLTKEKLLEVFDKTVEKQPIKVKKPKIYVQGGSAKPPEESVLSVSSH